MPPLVTPATEYLAVQEIESGEGIDAFREDVGDIKEVIRLSPTAHDAPLTVSFYAGDFQKLVQAVICYLLGAFLGDFGVPAVSFFFRSRADTEDAVDSLMKLALIAGHIPVLYHYTADS